MSELFDELKKTILDFQKANDAQLSQLQAGISSAATNDKVEALNAHLTELQAKHDELSKQANRLEVGGMSMNPKDKETVALQARQFFARKRGSDEDPSLAVRPVDIEAYQAYEKAFGQWVRRADAVNDPQIRATMQVGSDPDGGYWVPTQKMTEVIARLYETSDMRSISNVISITGDSVEWPNKASQAASGGWVGETTARVATGTPTTGTQTIYAREQYAMPEATQKLLDMSTINVEAWLGGEISEILSLTENTGFVTGNGVASPRGFLDYGAASVVTADATRAWGVLQYIPTGASGAIPNLSGSTIAHDADCFINAIAALKAQYRAGAVWAMNRLVEAEVRKMKDLDGRYLVQMGSVEAGVGFNLFGFPIRNLEDMPALASNSFSIAFGNFQQGYQIVDGRGLRVLRDPFTNKPYVRFYTTKWTGGDIRSYDALKLIKASAS